MKSMNTVVLFCMGYALLMAGCASKTPKAEPAAPSSAPAAEGVSSIDVEGLVRSLKLNRPVEVLGYQEASFNSCEVGYGFSTSHDCRKMTVAVIHVRLQCRDSEGTISNALGVSDLKPIAGQSVRWSLAGQDGIAQSDGEGYAEIQAVFPKSPRAQRLRLAVGLQFLYVRANEVSRVVTPRPWCADRDSQ